MTRHRYSQQLRASRLRRLRRIRRLSRRLRLGMRLMGLEEEGRAHRFYERAPQVGLGISEGWRAMRSLPDAPAASLARPMGYRRPGASQ